MGLARELHSTLQMGPPRLSKRRVLAILAGVTAALCCVSAFLFLVFRDHGRPKVMVNEQSSPWLALRKTAPLSTATKPATQAAKQADALASPTNTGENSPGVKVPFSIRKSSRVTVGPVKLRLLRTDSVLNTYDVSVISGRRSSSHKGLKVNQPWWIVVGRSGDALEFTATSIEAKGVSGYWTKSARSPQMNARAHSRMH